MAQKGGGGSSVKYSWMLQPMGMLCFVAPDSYQTLTKFWETTELSNFHDAELQQGTKEINEILSGLEKANQDPKRKLSLVRFHNRHFLVWARYGAIGQWDDEKTVVNALKLKVE
jgi:hypothetical protein